MRRTSAARRSGWAVSSWLGLCCGLMAAEPTTEVEEVVATCTPPGNGRKLRSRGSTIATKVPPSTVSAAITTNARGTFRKVRSR